jgi:hypothetical protein
MTESLWPRLAVLPLTIESYELELLSSGPGFEPERRTVLVRLLGAGTDGVGEDIFDFEGAYDELLAAGPALPLAGEWTLGGFCEHLATLQQWRTPPTWELARNFRNWSYESAALDLALRQGATTLADVLGREPRPVRFVNSLGLGDEPSAARVRDRVAANPSVRFKLDAAVAWSDGVCGELAAMGAVDTVDFKGRYGLDAPGLEDLLALYDRVLEAFPDATIEDPHDLPEVTDKLRPHAGRVSYDAPVVTVDALAQQPLKVRIVNVKPSRMGTLRRVFDLYAHAEATGLRLYGGGMGENGPARQQIQLLASLFHPDAPNDVAPSPYNAAVPAAGLPASPLPPPRPDGFRGPATTAPDA